MNTNPNRRIIYDDNLTRPEKALAAAQQVVFDDCVRSLHEICEQLTDNPAVSYILDARSLGFIEYPWALDVALRLIREFDWQCEIANGSLKSAYSGHTFTPNQIHEGEALAQRCITILERSNEPFSFAYHVEGSREVVFSTAKVSYGDAFAKVIEYLGDDVLHMRSVYKS